MLYIASTIVLILIGVGLAFRRQRAIHLRLMIAAFATDLLLVLYIEGTRHAVETVATSIHPVVWFHAAVSVSVLVLYVLMLRLGIRLVRGVHAARSTHRNLGMSFVVLRLLNYATSFVVVGHREHAVVQAVASGFHWLAGGTG